MRLEVDDIFKLLSDIPDPEIPVLNIVELGIVRSVSILEGQYHIKITPTYSGCPATEYIDKEIRKKLDENELDYVLEKQLSPAWTTDWITVEARQKLQDYGIAPPEQISADKSLLTGDPKHVTCPRCKSKKTKLLSEFGSTPCKSLFTCQDCLETFDYFKCI
jgi:ring-1,2-phenylacetyl-CoA epoxidase subunit PaaD